MTTYAVIPAMPDHIIPVADAMREADRREIWAVSRHTPREALEIGLRRSSLCWAALADGEAFALFGVAPLSLLSGTGVPWMLATDAIGRHARPFLRGSKPVVDDMKRPFRRLENWVDARNTLSIRWLRWLGFVIGEPLPAGRDGELFHYFWMDCNV